MRYWNNKPIWIILPGEVLGKPHEWRSRYILPGPEGKRTFHLSWHRAGESCFTAATLWACVNISFLLLLPLLLRFAIQPRLRGWGTAICVLLTTGAAGHYQQSPAESCGTARLRGRGLQPFFLPYVTSMSWDDDKIITSWWLFETFFSSCVFRIF